MTRRIPDLEPDAVDRMLSRVMGHTARVVEAVALGESSRETPWRIDVESEVEVATYLLRYGSACSRNEVAALRAMADHPIPTPRVIHWDESGDALGVPVFLSEWIEGEQLLPAMRRRESWAIDIYVDTALRLQSICADDLPEGTVQVLDSGETAQEVVDAAYARLMNPDELLEAAYRRLVETVPELPEAAFSNGDLWPANLLVKGRKLVGVIDWQHAGWSDPIFEFLLPFFLVPELRGLGIEDRFCRLKGVNPSVLQWYHGVEFFDSLAWVLKTGKPYEMHTAKSLRADLEEWLSAG